VPGAGDEDEPGGRAELGRDPAAVLRERRAGRRRVDRLALLGEGDRRRRRRLRVVALAQVLEHRDALLGPERLLELELRRF
jgi:hypothetical protein